MKDERAKLSKILHSSLCPIFLVLGFLCVGLAFVGVFVPGIPTTIFLIIALWAFSKSSDRLRWWLYNHPRFGSSLRAWHEHRVIPVRGKVSALIIMGISLAIVAVVGNSNWLFLLGMTVILLPISVWIVTRRSVIPKTD